MQKYIEHPLLRGLRAYVPEAGVAHYDAIADSMSSLREWAALPASRRPEVEYAVLVLRRPGESELTAADRDLLWQAFHVPAYSVFVDLEGHVLAHECEMQGALHVTNKAIFEEYRGRTYVTSLASKSHPLIRMETGIDGSLDSEMCECGRAGVRVGVVAVECALAHAAD
jgi:hypothetical protein